MDWSYRLLVEREQRLLARLSVFAASFSLEAAEGICGDDDDTEVLNGIASLVAKSVVSTEDDGETLRYRLLETVRAYASERLVESGEAVEIRDRHCAWFTEWVEQFAPSDRPSRWRAGLAVEADYANITEAVAWARAQQHDDVLGRIVAAVIPLLTLRATNSLGEGNARIATVADAALAALGEARADLRARLLAELSAEEYTRTGWTALPRAEEAVRVARQSGDAMTIVDTLLHLQHILRGTPRFAERLDMVNEAMAIAMQEGDMAFVRAAHYMRFALHLQLADRDAAEREAEVLIRDPGGRQYWPWFVEPVLAMLDGRFADTKSFMRAHRDEHLGPGMAEVYNGTMTQALYEQGRWRAGADAEFEFARWIGVVIARIVDDDVAALSTELERYTRGDTPFIPRPWFAGALFFLAEAAARVGDESRAPVLREQLSEFAGSAPMLADSSAVIGAADRYLGMLDAVLGDLDSAVKRFDAALAIETALRSPPLLARTKYWYGRTLRRTDPARSDTLLREANTTADELGMAKLATDCALLLKPSA
jgi:tetratricopeptide (TPR) repeat protein